jgi:hypothetical protein
MDHRHPNEDESHPYHSLQGYDSKIQIPGRNGHTNRYLNSAEAIHGWIFDLRVTIDAHGPWASK